MENKIVISILTGLLNLDNRNIGLTFISRPIVVSLIMGVIFGNVEYSLIMGIIIELLWIDMLPIGFYIPSNGTITASIAISISLAFKSKYDINIFPLLFPVSIFFGFIASKILYLIYKSHNSLSAFAREMFKRERDYLFLINLISIILAFIIFTSYTYITLILSEKLLWHLAKNPPPGLNRILTFVFQFMPFFAIVKFLSLIEIRKKLDLIVSGIAIMLFINYLRIGVMFKIMIFSAMAVAAIIIKNNVGRKAELLKTK